MLFWFKNEWADSFSINLLSCGMYTHRQCLGHLVSLRVTRSGLSDNEPTGRWPDVGQRDGWSPILLSFQPCCPGMLEGSTNTLSVPSSSLSHSSVRQPRHTDCALQNLPFSIPLPLFTSLPLSTPLSSSLPPCLSALCHPASPLGVDFPKISW